MKHFASLPFVLMTFLILGVAPFNAASAAGSDSVGQRILLAQSNGPTLDQAVEQVRRQYNGRIVSAETKVSGNREVHHIKVLTEDGKVKTVKVPGRTLDNG